MFCIMGPSLPPSCRGGDSGSSVRAAFFATAEGAVRSMGHSPSPPSLHPSLHPPSSRGGDSGTSVRAAFFATAEGAVGVMGHSNGDALSRSGPLRPKNASAAVCMELLDEKGAPIWLSRYQVGGWGSRGAPSIISLPRHQEWGLPASVNSPLLPSDEAKLQTCNPTSCSYPKP